MAEQRNEFDYSVSSLPATSRDRRLALSIAVITLLAFATMVPFAKIPLGRIDSFVPTLLAVVFITDLITAVLLFGQLTTTRSPAILVLATGYLFSSLIVIPHALTFPGAFAPAGLLGAGIQSTSLLYLLWRFGLTASWIGYAFLIGRTHSENARTLTIGRAIFWSVAIAIALVCALTLGATAGDSYLPRVLEGSSASLAGSLAGGAIALLSTLALLVLWKRGKSILDLWGMVAVGALILEAVAVAFFLTTRFTLGFYFIRLESLIVFKVVLVVLLAETGILHAGLSRANRALSVANQNLQRERENKLANAEAVVAVIGHEIRQPLTGIATTAGAAKRFLDRAQPDVEKVKQLLEKIDQAALRAGEVLASIRNSLRGGSGQHQPLDANSLVVETLELVRGDLNSQAITVNMNLSPDLTAISGNKGQLQEVIINLVQNAIAAMATTPNKPRAIDVTTSRPGSEPIVIAIEDTGPGIDPQKITSIFEPFITTKKTGTGLGLAICKMIVQQHGGNLSVAPGANGGARFEIALPRSSSMPQPVAEQSSTQGYRPLTHPAAPPRQTPPSPG